MLKFALYVFTAICFIQTINNYISGDFGNANTGFFVTLVLFGFSVWVANRPRKASKAEVASNNLVKSKTKNSSTKLQMQKPSTTKYAPIENAAKRLREVATRFDDLRFDAIFKTGPVRVSRVTKSRSTFGPGQLTIFRDRILVEYQNLKSKNPEVKTFEKKWIAVIGAAPNRFEIYFKDDSMFEFEPQSLEDFVVFTSFWQLFYGEISEAPRYLAKPQESNLGEKLRVVADYLDSNKEKLLANKGQLDVDELDFSSASSVRKKTQEFTPPKVGMVLEDCKLIKSLGGGGFGTVYEARLIKDESHRYAFKFMNQKEGVKPGSPVFHRYADSFLEEAKRSLNFTRSAYVVTAIEYGMHPWPWIAYPLLTGGTVDSLAENGPLTKDQWWNLAHDLLSALMDIHNQGIVHLDIKPDNIMSFEDRYLVLDLGISFTRGYELGIGGTRPFMSPEVKNAIDAEERNPEIGPAADIFSAGLTLLWATLKDRHRPLILQASIGELLSVLEEAGYDKERVALISKMLSDNPKSRSTAHELLFQVAPYIDIDRKIDQIEEANRRSDKDAAENLEGGEENYFEKELEGPFRSWQSIEKELEYLLLELKPAFFAFNLDIKGLEHSMYFQALYVGDGWVLECQSDNFGNLRLSKQQIDSLIRLGWEAPTDSSPNFQKMLDGINPHKMYVEFSSALEQAYQFSLSDLSGIRITAQNKNAY